jgi:Heparan-alpha-glucosaminide N-acetyltransferase, catalytic
MPSGLPQEPTMPTAQSPKARLVSLDQFRGYTVAGMVFVNFVGAFAVPVLLKHRNTYCSYADTIMPQFFFAVGFAFRLTFGRRAADEGLGRAYGHVVRRLLGLALVAIVIEHVHPRAATWQALVDLGPWDAFREALCRGWFGSPLMHIAVTSLWIVPVIRAGPGVRIAYMILSAVLQLFLSHWFYFDWVYHAGTDGGPLGFLTWSIPTIVGTLACDAVTTADGRPRVAAMFAWSAVLMMIGYLLSCLTTLYDVPADRPDTMEVQRVATDPVIPDAERFARWSLGWAEPPFVEPPEPSKRQHNYWMMSQRAATPSYHTFAAGLALAVYALFYLACDKGGWQLGLFRTLGSNALIAYILHNIVGDAITPFVPKDAPLWYVGIAFAIYFGLIYLFVHHLEKNKIFLKL